MRMYEVYNTDHPDMRPHVFRERDEAVGYIERCKAYTRSGEIAGRDYLAIRVVERESHPCTLCGAEVTAKDPVAYPYCESCHYTGASADALNGEALAWFQQRLPSATVGVEHTGGGCFWLAFRWPDDPVYYTATDGEASLPDDWQKWGYLGRYDGDDDCEGFILLEGVDESNDQWLPLIRREDVVVAIVNDRKERGV